MAQFHSPFAAGASGASGPPAPRPCPATLAGLIDGAIAALDGDPGRARRYLERLAHLLDAPRAPRVAPPSPADPAPALVPDRLVLPGTARGGLAGWQLRRVTDHVARHLDQPLVTAGLAAVAQLSAGHFCRAFKASLGETPHAYVTRQRVRRAQQLMLGSRDTLAQIAGACGLTDQAHLTRLFRRWVGTTPLAWRRQWHPGDPAVTHDTRSGTAELRDIQREPQRPR